MTKEEKLAWIKNASYTDLLRKWRFEPMGSEWFLGEIGLAYNNAIGQKRREVGDEAHTAASKEIGWENSVGAVAADPIKATLSK